MKLDFDKETVILIHGLGGSRLDMWPIARALRKTGLQTWTWSYRSVGTNIERHVKRLVTDLTRLDGQFSAKMHLVTHSMGGVISRAALSRCEPEQLQRVLMLAPPHQGSHVARMMAPYLSWIAPSLRQLSDEEGSYVRTLPNPLKNGRYEFGIIEAAKDRVIKQGGVLLDGCQHYAKVNGHHGILTWYADTIRLATEFIEHGVFESNDRARASNSESAHPATNAS